MSAFHPVRDIHNPPSNIQSQHSQVFGAETATFSDASTQKTARQHAVISKAAQYLQKELEKELTFYQNIIQIINQPPNRSPLSASTSPQTQAEQILQFIDDHAPWLVPDDHQINKDLIAYVNTLDRDPRQILLENVTNRIDFFVKKLKNLPTIQPSEQNQALIRIFINLSKTNHLPVHCINNLISLYQQDGNESALKNLQTHVAEIRTVKDRQTLTEAIKRALDNLSVSRKHTFTPSPTPDAKRAYREPAPSTAEEVFNLILHAVASNDMIQCSALRPLVANLPQTERSKLFTLVDERFPENMPILSSAAPIETPSSQPDNSLSLEDLQTMIQIAVEARDSQMFKDLENRILQITNPLQRNHFLRILRTHRY